MSRPKEQITILIPDGESYILLGVLRCLSEVKGVQLIVMSETKNAAMRYSRHVARYVHFPKTNQPGEWIARINSLVGEHAVDIVMPVFETAARKLIANKDLLTAPDKFLLPDSLAAFDTAWDKGLLSEHLRANGLPGPRSHRADQYNFDDPSKSQLRFPLLIKPTRESGAGKGIAKFESGAALKAYYEAHDPDHSYQLQEYIEGYDLGCNVLCRNGEILAHTIQKGTIFKNRAFTPQAGLKMIHDETVLHLARKLMGSLNWTGAANIDMRYDQSTGQFMVLEINTRFWYTVLASSIAGVNFPWLYCLAALGRPFDPPEYHEIEYFNNHGLKRALRTNPSRLLKVREIWNRTPVKYQVLDPGMTTYHLMWTLSSILKRKPRRQRP